MRKNLATFCYKQSDEYVNTRVYTHRGVRSVKNIPQSLHCIEYHRAAIHAWRLHGDLRGQFNRPLADKI